jgi:hypothetical protein
MTDLRVSLVLCRHWQGWLGFSQHPAGTAHSPYCDPEETHCASGGSSGSSSSHNSSSGVSRRLLLSSPEVLDLGVCLPAGSSKQLMTLTNTAEVPVEFAWQYGIFTEQCAVMSGRLSVVPTSGERACPSNSTAQRTALSKAAAVPARHQLLTCLCSICACHDCPRHQCCSPAPGIDHVFGERVITPASIHCVLGKDLRVEAAGSSCAL